MKAHDLGTSGPAKWAGPPLKCTVVSYAYVWYLAPVPSRLTDTAVRVAAAGHSGSSKTSALAEDRNGAPVATM